MRWNLPGQGLVYPDAFIPLFEKDGSIADLDFYMMEKTCGYLRQWLDDGGVFLAVSVNFSRVTLYRKRFRERFLELAKLPHKSAVLSKFFLDALHSTGADQIPLVEVQKCHFPS